MVFMQEFPLNNVWYNNLVLWLLQGLPKSNVQTFNSSQWMSLKRPNGLKSLPSATIITFSK